MTPPTSFDPQTAVRDGQALLRRLVALHEQVSALASRSGVTDFGVRTATGEDFAASVEPYLADDGSLVTGGFDELRGRFGDEVAARWAPLEALPPGAGFYWYCDARGPSGKLHAGGELCLTAPTVALSQQHPLGKELLGCDAGVVDEHPYVGDGEMIFLAADAKTGPKLVRVDQAYRVTPLELDLRAYVEMALDAWGMFGFAMLLTEKPKSADWRAVDKRWRMQESIIGASMRRPTRDS